MFSLFCKDIKSSFDKDYNLKDTVNAYSKIVKFESCRENIHESGTHSIKYVAVLFILVTLYQGHWFVPFCSGSFGKYMGFDLRLIHISSFFSLLVPCEQWFF